MSHCRNIDCPNWLQCNQSCTKTYYTDRTTGVNSYSSGTEKTLVLTWKHKVKP